MLDRRGFLSLFGGAVAAAVVDPERLLWVPGKKMISIPSIPKPQNLGVWDIQYYNVRMPGIGNYMGISRSIKDSEAFRYILKAQSSFVKSCGDYLDAEVQRSCLQS